MAVIDRSTPAQANLVHHDHVSNEFELRFQSLTNPGRALAFPCDSGGHVDMDALSDRARTNYLGARALIGRDYSYPAVLPASH